jgi:hypothetical protein
LKKLLLLVCLAVIATPHIAKAWDDDDRGGDRDHDKINADEIANIGLGSAAVISLGGYLLLRRRNLTQN